MAEWDDVDRPKMPPFRSESKHAPLRRAVLGTADTGRAVRVPVNGHAKSFYPGALAKSAQRHGLQFRSHYDRDTDSIIMWCEARTPARDADVPRE